MFWLILVPLVLAKGSKGSNKNLFTEAAELGDNEYGHSSFQIQLRAPVCCKLSTPKMLLNVEGEVQASIIKVLDTWWIHFCQSEILFSCYF